jgi:serine/threonine protein kinase
VAEPTTQTCTRGSAAVSKKLLAGRYEYRAALGTGAMGEVWRADDLILGRPVAIKRLRPSPDAELDPGSIDRIMREARVAARLHHRNTVAVFDLITEDGLPHVVMEYIDGESLAERIRHSGPLRPREAAEVIGQVASALEAAHRAGIVHRDVKPANILIDRDGTAKLADFGIAREFGDVNLTSTGQLIGTLAYMAPEVARTGIATDSSDMWSLGAALYAAVDGHAPFDDGSKQNTTQLLIRLVTEPIIPARHADLLQPLLMSLLDPDPTARPTAAEVRHRIAALVRSPSTDPGASEAQAIGIDTVPDRAIEPLDQERSGDLAAVEHATSRAEQSDAEPSESASEAPADVTVLRVRGSRASILDDLAEVPPRDHDATGLESESESECESESESESEKTVLRQPLTPEPVSAGRPRRRRRRIVLVSAGIAALTVLAGAVVASRTADRRPAAITDLKVTKLERDGMASVTFSRPAYRASKLSIYCEYGKGRKDCGTWDATGRSGQPVSLAISLPAGVAVDVSIQACIGVSARRTPSKCDAEVTGTITTNAQLPPATAGPCASTESGISFAWYPPASEMSVDHWAAYMDGGYGRDITKSEVPYVVKVPPNGGMHTLQVVGIDDRGEAGSPLTLRCRATRVTHGSYRDATGDGWYAEDAPVDIKSLTWKLVDNGLSADISISSANLGDTVAVLWIDADHNSKTGSKGLGCPEPGLDSDSFGADYYIQADGSGGGNADTGPSYCGGTATRTNIGFKVKVSATKINIYVLLSTIHHAEDYLFLKVGVYTIRQGQSSSTFQDFVPDVGRPAAKVVL